MGLNVCINHRGQGIYQNCLNNGHTLTFDLFTARSSLLPYAFVWEKHLKILFSKTEDGLWLNLCIYHLEWGSTKVAKIIVIHQHFTARSSLLLYAFVWAPYICMEKMLIISNGFSSEASGPMLLKFHAESPWAGE